MARWWATRSPAVALVPLRFFLGGTFLYAGLDKLLSPEFLTAGAPGSIGEQLAAFARHSPLAPIIHLVQPWAIEVGILIALAEIGVGLGAITGYGFRLAAAGGAALALLFWLTASWATKPYYYGPDLPYAAGWITLALAGHGDAFVVRWRERALGSAGQPRPVRGTWATGAHGAAVIARRTFLEAGVLGTAALVVASLAVPMRAVLGGSATEGGARGPLSPPPSTGPQPTGTPLPTDTPPPTLAPGVAVASLADVQGTGATAFTIPFDAPRPLPAGDPAVIVKLADGSYAAFDATCTHAGCIVEWDQPDGLLVCPCHGAVFDPGAGGRVLEGPTDLPLTELPLMLDPATGRFLLRTG